MTSFFCPQRLADGLQALADPANKAVLVAGCTDLMVVDHAEGRRHGTVIDVLRIPELQGITEGVTADGRPCLDIGASVTFSALREDPRVSKVAPIIPEMAATIGAWQIQNRATVGGNIANASPAGDSLPVWLALDAECEVASVRGTRVIPYHAMHVAYRETALAEDEMIVRLRVPIRTGEHVQYFKKVGTREAQAISKVVVAMTAWLKDGKLTDTRVAVGSVAATPVRLPQTEQLLDGVAPNESIAQAAGDRAKMEVSPIDDVRSSAEYRSQVLSRVIRRMVLQSGAAF